MQENLFSKVDPTILCHIIHRVDTMPNGRVDVVPPTEFIQMATLRLNKGTTFNPHRHITKEGPFVCVAQESWVVLSGSVKCHLYDLNNELTWEVVLMPGDCSITLRGGHNYTILEDGTQVLEFKTGPYSGQQNDKVFI